jgi:hypothetical protein
VGIRVGDPGIPSVYSLVVGLCSSSLSPLPTRLHLPWFLTRVLRWSMDRQWCGGEVLGVGGVECAVRARWYGHGCLGTTIRVVPNPFTPSNRYRPVWRARVVDYGSVGVRWCIAGMVRVDGGGGCVPRVLWVLNSLPTLIPPLLFPSPSLLPRLCALPAIVGW